MGLFSKAKIKKLRHIAGYGLDGLSYSQYELAECYHYGRDTEQDYKEALKYYVEAARYKYNVKSKSMESVPEAAYMVAVYYAEGKVVQKNLKFALKLLEDLMHTIKEQKEGRNGSYYMISDELICSIKDKRAEIIAEIIKNDNHPGAESYYKYLEKKDENKKAAMELLTYSVSKGYEDAIIKFAYNIYNIDVTAEREKFDRMLEFCTDIAKRGNAEMCHFLANFYSRDYFYLNKNKVNNIKFNLNTAVEYYNKAFSLGDLCSACELGESYHLGRLDLNKDYNKAMEYLFPVANRQLCLNENFWIIEARTGMGDALLQLDNYTQAIQWYEKALELPWDDPSVSYDSDICWKIGGIYLNYLNQKATAREWFNRGVLYNDNPNCKFELRNLGEVY